MKFSLAKEHLHFYQQHGYVEFEGIIKIQKLQQILYAIRKEHFESNEQHYEKHHDLWRSSHEIKKSLFHRDIASIVADLNGVKPLRVGFDQLIPKGFEHEKPLSLNEMGSIQGIAGGYLLCLQDCPGGDIIQPDLVEGERLVMAPFSTEAGNMLFIDPDIAIDFSLMPCDHLLISFAGPKAIYCHNASDPHNHEFKKYSYSFGDKISESELPTVLREFNL
ncbi:MAG: hypothetical protein AAGG81_02820 [Chlamydiota bacterium]